MPITAIVLSSFWDMACSLSLAPLPSILLLVGREHGRAIPLTDLSPRQFVSKLRVWPHKKLMYWVYATESAASAVKRRTLKWHLLLVLSVLVSCDRTRI